MWLIPTSNHPDTTLLVYRSSKQIICEITFFVHVFSCDGSVRIIQSVFSIEDRFGLFFLENSLLLFYIFCLCIFCHIFCKKAVETLILLLPNVFILLNSFINWWPKIICFRILPTWYYQHCGCFVSNLMRRVYLYQCSQRIRGWKYITKVFSLIK